MLSIQEGISFIKSQASRAENIISKHPEDPNAEKHLRPISNKFHSVVEMLESYAVMESKILEQQKIIEGFKARLKTKEQASSSLSLTSEEVINLPEELKAQLSISDSDQLEYQLLEIFKERGGSLSLDQAIVYYFEKTGEIVERTKMNQRLYRLIQKEALSPIDGKKGCYTIYEDEAINTLE